MYRRTSMYETLGMYVRPYVCRVTISVSINVKFYRKFYISTLLPYYVNHVTALNVHLGPFALPAAGVALALSHECNLYAVLSLCTFSTIHL